MKVINVENGCKQDFYTVESGSTFIDGEGDLYMKITPTCDAEDADNAVNLKVGYGCKFNDAEEVKSVDARVVVFQR